MGFVEDQKQDLSDQASQSSPFWPMFAWLAVVAGTILRLTGLPRQSLWMDEGYTAWMVSHPWREIIRLLRADTAPPFYYLLLRAWTTVFGNSEAGLRSLSVAAGALSLLFVLDIAGRLLTRPAAVAAAVWAVALGYNQVYFAQEARFYALMALLVLAGLDCLLRYLSTRNRFWLAPLVLVLTASLYTHNMMLPYVVALFLCWIVLSPRNWKEIVRTAIAVGLLYLPWAIFVLPAQLRLVNQGFWVSRPDYPALMSLVASLFNVPSIWAWNETLARFHVHMQVSYGPLWALIFLAMVSLAMSIGLQRGTRRRQALALLILMLLPPTAVAIYSYLRTPILMEKTFLPSAALMPILLLLPLNLPWSTGGLRSAALGVGILLIFMLGSLIACRSAARKEDWRGAARAVRGIPLEPDQRRLFVFVSEDGQLPFQYYYHFRDDEDVTGVPGGFFDQDPPRAMRRVNGPEDLNALAERLKNGNYGQVLLIASHLAFNDPNHLAAAFLQQQYPHVKSIELWDVTIFEFDKTGDEETGPRWADAAGFSSPATAGFGFLWK